MIVEGWVSTNAEFSNPKIARGTNLISIAFFLARGTGGSWPHRRWSIRILAPQSAIQKHDLASLHIVAKPESPRAQPVLALALRNAFEFLDGMLVALVVRSTERIAMASSNRSTNSGCRGANFFSSRSKCAVVTTDYAGAFIRVV